MRILVQIEHVNGIISEASHDLLLLAKSLDGTTDALVCAGTQDDVVSIASQLHGADVVIGVAADELAQYLPLPYQQCLNAAIAAKQPDLVLISYSTAGVDLAAGAAVANDREIVCYVSDLSVDGDVVAVTSQIYGGKLLANTNMPLPGIAVVMPGAIKADGGDGAAPAIEALDVDLGAASQVRLVETLVPETGGVDLTKAERIVCVGRALGNADKLPMVEALAGKLGAEIAGSRPVIDAGWLPKARQVGKSGTKVKPKLYLMAGISGAPEHLEGMQDADLIIALNSDEQAPIFSKAHYGAVCDMFKVLPALNDRLD
jgi:electron transfer flavoprotein alpha subunit